MNKLQKIKEACIKANPEIVELKFGCEVKHKKRGIAEIIKSVAGGWMIWFDNEDKPIYAIDVRGNSEVIGRPITLADVLIVVQLENWEERMPEDDRPRTAMVGQVVGNWNLKDNNLSNQSPETIDFIYKLLNKT